MLCPNVSAKSLRVLPMSFEVASFDVDVFLHCGNSWKLAFGFLYVWWQAWLKVEYLTPANDASSRLYATQICAQKLPRELRLLIYGRTHKEVDLTGAHYELIRALTGSVTLPPTHLLRDRLKATWVGEQGADPELLNEVKMLPIRIINSGAARALKHVTDQNLSIPPWIEAFAFDLDTAREAFTAHMRTEGRSPCQKSTLFCCRSH